MSPEMAYKPKSLLILIAFFVLASRGGAQPAPQAYPNVLAMLDRLVETGSVPALRVVIEALATGDGNAEKVSAGLIQAEKAAIGETISAHFASNPAFGTPTVEGRPFPSIPSNLAPGDAAEGAAISGDDSAILAVADKSSIVLIVRIVDYHSGRFDLYETRASLLEPTTKQRLALDVGWTSRVDGDIQALFINGARAK